MNKDLEGAKAFISDLVQEKELTFIVDVLKTTKRCVGPLADLLRMVDGYAASLEHDGEMYRRAGARSASQRSTNQSFDR